MPQKFPPDIRNEIRPSMTKLFVTKFDAQNCFLSLWFFPLCQLRCCLSIWAVQVHASRTSRSRQTPENRTENPAGAGASDSLVHGGRKDSGSRGSAMAVKLRPEKQPQEFASQRP